MKYLVIGPTIINDISYNDGSKKFKVLGGSVFSLAGIKLWEDSTLYISNVGSDFSNYYGKWMNDNNLSFDGLNYILPHTWYTKLNYQDKGLHDESSIYGSEDEELLEKLDVITIDQILKHCNIETKGIYIEINEKSNIWDNISKIREFNKIKIMWEIPTSATLDPKRKSKVLDCIKKCDIYSINLPEAFSLFDSENEDAIIKKIIDLKTPCFLRVGKKGSYMINKGYNFCKSIDIGQKVDTTGCGNTSTSAALWAFSQGYNNYEIALIANISAAFNLLDFGPIKDLSNYTQNKALDLFNRYKL